MKKQVAKTKEPSAQIVKEQKRQVPRIFKIIEELIDNKDPLVKPIFIGETSPLLEQLAIVCENMEEASVFLNNTICENKVYSIFGYSGLQKYDFHVLYKNWSFIPYHLLKENQKIDYFKYESINTTHKGVRRDTVRYNKHENLFSIRPLLKTIILDEALFFLTKGEMHSVFPSFTLRTRYIRDVQVLDCLSIIKPINGHRGHDVIIVETQEQYEEATAIIVREDKGKTKDINPYLESVISDYIKDIDTISLKDLELTRYKDRSNYEIKRKYNVRTYLILSNFGYYSFKVSQLYLARDEYKIGDWSNQYIHDSKNGINEEDFYIDENDWRYSKLEAIKEEIGKKSMNYIKNYKESKNFYEIISFDIMFDCNKKAWMVDCNPTPTLLKKDILSPMFKSFQRQFLEWEYSVVNHLFYTLIDPSLQLNLKVNYNTFNTSTLNNIDNAKQLTLISNYKGCQSLPKQHKIICMLENKDYHLAQELESKYIIMRTTDELEEYISHKNRYFSTNASYSVYGSMGISRFPYHKYFKDWILVAENKEASFRLTNAGKQSKASSLLTSVINNANSGIFDKVSLYKSMSKYMAKQYFSKSEIKFPCIIKGGKTQICGNAKDLSSYKFQKGIKYSICEYIDDPELFYPEEKCFNTIYVYEQEKFMQKNNKRFIKSRKFHLRIYFFMSSWGRSVLYPKFRIMTAKLPYKKGDYSNKNIHKTRIESTNDDYFYPHPFHTLDDPENLRNRIVYDQVQEIYSKIVKQIKAKPYTESKLAYEIFSLDCMTTRKKKVILLECNSVTSINMFNYRTDFEEGLVNTELSFIKEIFEINIEQRKLSIDNATKFFDDRQTATYYHQQAKKKTIAINKLTYIESSDNSNTSGLFKALVEADIPVDVWVYKKTLLSNEAYIRKLIKAGKKEVEVFDITPL